MDIYAEITNRIIDQMETGIIPWQKPWIASGNCVSYATGKPYVGLHEYSEIHQLHVLYP